MNRQKKRSGAWTKTGLLKTGILFFALLLGSLAFTGCAKRESPGIRGEQGGDDRLFVVTTIFPYYDFVRQIGGDRVRLNLVVPAGMDSHSFEPTPADMITIQKADLMICNGGAMEQWVDQVVASLDTSRLRRLTMMDYVDVVEEEVVEGMEEEEHGHEHSREEEEAGEFDAHDGQELDIEYRLNTMVADISPERVITALNREDGLLEIKAEAVILAMGCRERSRGALNIPGYRPAGIFSAGTAQRLVNMEGYLPGRKVVILGSGDIGLIMARRMTLEGAKVKAVAELMPYSGGLRRNIVQCLEDYGIPLKLSHTVVDIKGRERVEGVTLAKVDERGKPIPGTEEEYACDTLLLSVGLIPENEISGKMGVELNPVTSGPVVNESLETNIPGVFACGNVLHVHDLVDFVSQEAAAAGRFAADFIRNKKSFQENQEREEIRDSHEICIISDGGVRYTIPSFIRPEYMEESLTIRFRVGRVYRDCYVCVYFDEKLVIRKKRLYAAPGEMEELILKKAQLMEHPALKQITIKIQEA